MRTLLTQVFPHIEETLSSDLKQKNHLPSVQQSYKNIHFPSDKNILKKSVLRLKYDELFFLQLGMTRQKISTRRKIKGYKTTFK